MEEERIKVWQMGMYNYTDIGLDKPVMYKENFLKQIASDTQSVDVTDEHSNSILGSLSNFKYEDGVLYANKPSDIDITGNGFSPVFNCDLVDMGDYYEPRNFTMTSVGLTKNPRSNILYNSITEEMDKVSDELRAMLDRKEETIAEQREEIGILKKQMEELREKSKSSDETLNEFKALQKQFDDDTKGMEMFQKFSVEELEHMKNTKIVTEPIKAVGSQSVDTITDGDADDIPKEDQVDEYSQEYFEKWERENTNW